MAAASKLDEAETLLANCFLDLTPIAGLLDDRAAGGARSPDHVARFARNLDFPSYGVADNASVVLVYHPTDRFGFVTIGWPGMIGALSGMNEHGLTLANMEVPPCRRSPAHAMPYALLYRTVAGAVHDRRRGDRAAEDRRRAKRRTISCSWTRRASHGG